MSSKNNTDWKVKIDEAVRDITALPPSKSKTKTILISLLQEKEKETLKRLEERVGMLRQWLNEDRITDPEKLITNYDIKYWLNILEDEN